MGNFKTKNIQNKQEHNNNIVTNTNYKDDYDIKYLNINTMNLYELPNDIGLYRNLDTLDCSYNNLTRLNNLPNNLKNQLY
jgi:hypothetical protein